MEALNIMLKLL